MRIKRYSKYEIVILIIGILYAIFLIVQNPQPFGKIALAIFLVFALTLHIKHSRAKRISQVIVLIAALLFSILGTKSLLFNKTNRTFFEQDTKVVFTKLSFSESLQQAKTENKLMFLDFYTVWCAPCIKFHKEVLDDVEVASYMNKAFINAKYNLYEGEGISLKETYKVSYVPRFLIVDTNGTIVEDISTDSELTADRMIDISKKYINKH